MIVPLFLFVVAPFAFYQPSPQALQATSHVLPACVPVASSASFLLS